MILFLARIVQNLAHPAPIPCARYHVVRHEIMADGTYKTSERDV